MYKTVVQINGPTSVGKGFSLKLLHQSGLAVMAKLFAISIGDEIRKHLDVDPKFKSKWSGELAKGHLISTQEAFRLLQLALPKEEVDILVIDGFNRTTKQVECSESIGLSGANSINLFLRATRSTCRQRFIHRLTSSGGDGRNDQKLSVFEDRYTLHQGSVEKITKKLMRTKTVIRTIPADDDIPTRVFPDLLSHILAHHNDVLGTDRRFQQGTFVNPAIDLGEINSNRATAFA